MKNLDAPLIHCMPRSLRDIIFLWKNQEFYNYLMCDENCLFIIVLMIFVFKEILTLWWTPTPTPSSTLLIPPFCPLLIQLALLPICGLSTMPSKLFRLGCRRFLVWIDPWSPWWVFFFYIFVPKFAPPLLWSPLSYVISLLGCLAIFFLLILWAFANDYNDSFPLDFPMCVLHLIVWKLTLYK